MYIPMACMPMLSRLLLIVYGGIGDTIPMVGGAVIPTMVGVGTAGMARVGTLDIVGEVGMEAAGGDTITTIILIMTAGITEVAIGKEAIVGVAVAFIPIAVLQVHLMYIGIALAQLVALHNISIVERLCAEVCKTIKRM